MREPQIHLDFTGSEVLLRFLHDVLQDGGIVGHAAIVRERRESPEEIAVVIPHFPEIEQLLRRENVQHIVFRRSVIQALDIHDNAPHVVFKREHSIISLQGVDIIEIP